MTYVDLQLRIHDHPFKPFKIKMVNNTVYEVNEPWTIIVGQSSALIVTRTMKDDRGFSVAMDWRTVSIAHMMELSDVEPPKSGTRKRAS